jgi:hypothetical protein
MPLSAKKEAVALVLASGRSVAQAATVCGAGVRTIRRWQAEDDRFRQRMQEMRTEMFSQAAGRLSGLLDKAAQTMGELLDSEAEGIRLQAASRILEHCPKKMENAPVVAQGPAVQDYGALALADPVAAGLVVQLLSRAAARQTAAVECVVQPKSAVTADLARATPVSSSDNPSARNHAGAGDG